MNLTLFEDIRKEFSVDNNGVTSVSLRGLARMTGKDRRTIKKLLLKLSGTENIPEMLKTLSGYDLRLVQRKNAMIEDTVASQLIQYYAFQGEDTAQKYAMAFMAIGFRSVVQNLLNWQSPNKKDYSTFLLKAPRVWTKVFEDDIYDDLARLTGLTWDKKTHRKPCLFAKLTFELVYRYLPQEVYQTLKQTQEEHGGYIHKIHEFLSPDGLESLKFHLTLVANILSGCSNIYEAKRLINQSVTKEYQLSLFSK